MCAYEYNMYYKKVYKTFPGIKANKHYSAKELLAMIERSANKNSMAEGNALVSSLTSLVDDFFIGNTHDGNLGAMLNHYADSGAGKDDGLLTNFWT